jgi:hypothetical protein
MHDLGNPIGSVTDSSPSLVRIEISKAEDFEKNKTKLGVGQYLLIASGNNLYLLATITAVRASYIDRSKPGLADDGDGGDADLSRSVSRSIPSRSVRFRRKVSSPGERQHCRCPPNMPM